MGVTQPLKGNTNKYYNVITDFKNGIDKTTADDIAPDSSFRDLKNFYSENTGALSKRPGVYNSNFVPFIKAIVEENYGDRFSIVPNKFGETKEEVLPKLQDFYNTILCGIRKSKTTEGRTINFDFDKVVGCQTITNNRFFEALQDYETILEGNYSNKALSSIMEFSCIFAAGGFTTIGSEEESQKTCGLYLTRFAINMEYNSSNGYEVALQIDSVDPTTSRRWLYKPDNYAKTAEYISDSDEYRPLGDIDMVSYNGSTYMPSGRDYLIEIRQNPDTKSINTNHPEESDIFKVIGGIEQENLYEPTSIEVSKIGFNILSNSPLDFISPTGVAEKVRGVFYSVDVTDNGETFKQPVVSVPYNNPFNLHILYTGDTKPNTPKYRPNNGETDVTINAYKDLPGNWLDDDKEVWVCSGINSDQNFELQIILGNDTFISYMDTTRDSIDDTGYINRLNDLVFSSSRIKLINNQLVLYGGHGYLFFSEYDVFSYFPNYYYAYIATEVGEEEVTSINYFRQFYGIFTNKRIKKMTGVFGADDFGIYPLNDFIGCPNGRTVRAVGNNLIFLGNDGLYKLKQGYLGEGTENVEKIDNVISGELNVSTVLQAFTMNNNYIVVRNDGYSWFVYNTETEAFYEYNLESEDGQVYTGDHLDDYFKKNAMPFYSVFDATLYDINGDFLIVPMYKYNYSENFSNFSRAGVEFMIFRFSDLNFIDYDRRHKDGVGFISTFETHALNMGYPTHNKKFKDIYIKIINDSGHVIPLYITVQVDDNIVINPDDYEIVYNELTNTYYYVKSVQSNYALDISKALGEFTLGVDNLGNKSIQQIKIRVGQQGRSIKIKLSDGYNDITELSTGGSEETGLPIRNRNNYKFTVSTIGIIYKLKKVKEG